MESDDLDDAIRTLERDRDRQRQDLDRLRREYDALATKLRYPGTKFLVELEYKLVYDATVTAGWSGSTGALTLTSAFDTLPGALHAVYHISAYATASTTPVLITDGSVIVAPTDAITIAVQRQLQTGPTRTEAKLAIYNSSGSTNHSVAVRVWRRLGMGS